MSINSLSDFIQLLEENNEIIRIKEYVNPELEISEIVDRVSKSKDGGKALLFENTGTEFPLLINAFGSISRMNHALRTKYLDEIGEGLEQLLKTVSTPKTGFLEKFKMIPLLKDVSEWFPKSMSGKGDCQKNIIKDANINQLPVLKCWPKDGGRFVTLPVVITKDPITGIRNVGMYRMQVFDDNKTGMHWHKHKVGAQHFEEYKKLGKKMPVAVILGGDPVYTFAATAPLPDNIDEFLFAGFLRKKSVGMVKCLTQDIEVPADADIVIEGYVDPQEDLLWEGPFGDHTGYYSLPDWYPAFHITAITYRDNAVYPATIVGIPPQEDYYFGKATERIFLNPIKFAIVPEIIDLDLPAEGVAHNLTIVQIEKKYPGQGMKVINSLWGAGQMMFNKVMISIDKKINNYRDLAEILINNVDLESDLFITKGPMDVLDHAAIKLGFGGKLGIDGTKKFEEEKISDSSLLRGLVFNSNNIKFETNESLIKEGIPVLFVASGFDVCFNDIVREIKGNYVFGTLKMICVLDPNVLPTDLSVIFWILLNNIDPSRDCKIEKIDKNPVLIVDGRRKVKDKNSFTRDWPNIIVMDDATLNLVDEKWQHYGIGEFIPSPSLKFKNLLFGNEAKATDY